MGETKKEREEGKTESIIQKQLESLPHEQKKAVNLVSEGYSYKEIAKFLDRPLNTIRTLIRRARLKLNKSIKSLHLSFNSLGINSESTKLLKRFL